jgi:hypothetical protein
MGWPDQDFRGLLRALARDVEHGKLSNFSKFLPICMFHRKMHILYRNMLARALSLSQIPPAKPEA